MTDNILANGFLGREPAWHGLGTVVPHDQHLSVAQAISIAGANYQVDTYPVTIDTPWENFTTSRVAIVRGPCSLDPDPAILGYASEGYQVVQNSELGELMTAVSDLQGWPVETVGVLGRGEKFFLTLQASTVEIEGDGGVTNFFLLADGKDGGTATSIAVTPVRVVCQNTLKLGLASASINLSVVHRGDTKNEIAFAVDVVSQLQSAQEAVTAAMRLLAKTPVDARQRDRILDAAYPEPTATRGVLTARQLLGSTITLDEYRLGKLNDTVKRHEDWARTVKLYRETAVDRLRVFNDEYPRVANTAWAVANAVAEVESYRDSKSVASRGRDVLWGSRGQNVERAFVAAQVIAERKLAKTS